MSKLQRFLFLIPVCVLAVASIVASGGGGGDEPPLDDGGGSSGLTGGDTGGTDTGGTDTGGTDTGGTDTGGTDTGGTDTGGTDTGGSDTGGTDTGGSDTGGTDTGGGGSTGTVSGTCPPLKVGDTWTNSITQSFMGAADTWTETVTVISNDGVEIVIEQTGAGYFGSAYTVATVLEISGSAVVEVGAADGEYTLEPPIPVCPTPDVGTSFEQIEPGGDVRTSGIVTAVSEEAVDVAAGSFSAIKTVYDLENRMVTPTLLGTDTQWFADGIGPVKRLTVVPDSEYSYSVELQCYDFGADGSAGDCGG